MVTDELIRLVKESGFDAVRVPASWDQYADQATARIDPSWLDRVRQVVRYCASNELYVIVNIHWDGGWLERNVTPDKQAENNARQKAYWKQIATHLRDFDERLLFASANEPNAVRRDNLTDDALELHLASRAYYLEYVTRQARTNGLLPFYWTTASCRTWAPESSTEPPTRCSTVRPWMRSLGEPDSSLARRDATPPRSTEAGHGGDEGGRATLARSFPRWTTHAPDGPLVPQVDTSSPRHADLQRLRGCFGLRRLPLMWFIPAKGCQDMSRSGARRPVAPPLPPLLVFPAG
jgi:hypothetical protein